jgi:DNA-binding MarR family transcriptional regulator
MDQHNVEDKVYVFIRGAYIRQHGSSPTLREIAAGCYMSPPSVVRYLDRLEAHGRIARRPGKSRGITVLDPEQDG